MGNAFLQSLIHGLSLDRFSPSQLGAVFFVVFWILTSVALVRARHTVLRRIYVGLFLMALLIPGLAGKNYWLWPFQTWHLWGGIQATQSEFYELYAIDATGRRFVYDRQAIPPVLNTQVHVFARKLLEWPDGPDKRELTTFLLAQANAWRIMLCEEIPTQTFPAYPARQFGAAWKAQDLYLSGRFNHLLARRVRYTYHDGGRHFTLVPVEERSFP